MAIAYDGINYFPMGVNFMEENAMEVIEAKYGIKGTQRRAYRHSLINKLHFYTCISKLHLALTRPQIVRFLV